MNVLGVISPGLKVLFERVGKLLLRCCRSRRRRFEHDHRVIADGKFHSPRVIASAAWEGARGGQQHA